MLIPLALSVVAANMGDFAGNLAESKFRTVAVFPEVLEETEDGIYRLPLPMQQSKVEMERVYSRLKHVANDTLTVVDPKTVRRAALKFSVGELNQDDVKMQILRNAKADVLVLGVQSRGVEASSEMTLVAWAPSSQESDQNVPVSYRQETRRSLSDLAFAGKSFELRRWNENELTLPGFRDDVSDHHELVGLGYQHELNQARQMRPELPHPLSIKEFPFKITIAVNHQPRELIPIGDRYYLTASDGETVEFWVQNRTGHKVLLGLYIDGENTLGKKFQHPLQTPTENHWVLPPGKRTVRSWYSPAKKEKSPLIVRREPGFTGGTAGGDPSGTITAMFYTDGTRGIDVPPPIRVRGVNIEAGEPEPAELRTMPGRKGLMLAAVTIHYRSSEEMKALRGQN
jgi:hypothetical protein